MALTEVIENPQLLRDFSKPDFNLPRRGWKMEPHELSAGIVLAKLVQGGISQRLIIHIEVSDLRRSGHFLGIDGFDSWLDIQWDGF